MMKWERNLEYGFYYSDMENDNHYAIDFISYKRPLPWIAIYSVPSQKFGGKISKKLQIGQGDSKNWQFATKEEAMAICEKHYKFLILQ